MPGVNAPMPTIRPYKYQSKVHIVVVLDIFFFTVILSLWVLLFVFLLRSILISRENAKLQLERAEAEDLEYLPPLNESMINGTDTDFTEDDYWTSVRYKSTNAHAISLCVIFFLGSIVIGIPLLAGFGLYKSSTDQKLIDGGRGITLCKLWRVVSILSTALLMSGFIFLFLDQGNNSFEVTCLLVCILYRLASIYIVQEYMNEMGGPEPEAPENFLLR